VKFQEKKWWRC